MRHADHRMPAQLEDFQKKKIRRSLSLKRAMPHTRPRPERFIPTSALLTQWEEWNDCLRFRSYPSDSGFLQANRS